MIETFRENLSKLLDKLEEIRKPKPEDHEIQCNQFSFKSFNGKSS